MSPASIGIAVQRSSRPWKIWVRVVCLLLGVAGQARGQGPRPETHVPPPHTLLVIDDNDDPGEVAEDEYVPPVPGLIGEYVLHHGSPTAHQRVDETLVHDESSPIIPFEFTSAVWRGELSIMNPGRHQFAFHAEGEAAFLLDGKSVIQAKTNGTELIRSSELELDFGPHAIEIRYTKPNASPGAFAVYWTGPNFDWEQIPPWFLSHEKSLSPREQAKQGEILASTHRCDACHAQDPARPMLKAPALDRLQGNIHPDWMVQWLMDSGRHPAETDPKSAGGDSRRNMPYFQLDEQSSRNIVAALLGPLNVDRANTPRPSANKTAQGSPAAGKETFLTVGCLACHSWQSLKGAGPLGGGDLTQIAEKRPPEFLKNWLREPARLNADHRMPTVELSDQETIDLVAWLAEQRGTPADAEPAPAEKPGDAPLDPDQGWRLIDRLQCGNCHRLPAHGEKKPSRARTLDKSANWNQGCLDVEWPREVRHPTYRLSANDIDSLRQYYLLLSDANRPDPANSKVPTGETLLAVNHCTSCHARGTRPGIAAQFSDLSRMQPELSPLTPALTPPALNSVGDKLSRDSIDAVLQGKSQKLRPWLKVRMPRYAHSAEERASLISYLAATDQIPAELEKSHAAPRADTIAQDELLATGARLLTSEGFGCTSCHQIGKSIPKPSSLAAQGTNLSMVGQRLKKSWFQRWVRNPARFVPRMEMPSIQIPVRGALDETIETQLEAIWQVLNQPGFTPPRPNPVRIARCTDDSRRAIVLTDLIEQGDQVFLRPVVIGLPNRHNVLFDLECGRLAAYWLGDTALQHTRGKSWFWEVGGRQLLPWNSQQPDLDFLGDDDASPRDAKWSADFDTLMHEPAGGVSFTHRVDWSNSKSATGRSSLVRQSFLPLPGEEGAFSGGFRRTITISRLPKGSTARLFIAPDSEFVAQNGVQGIQILGEGKAPLIDVVPLGNASAALARRGDSDGYFITGNEVNGEIQFALEYRCRISPDRVIPRQLPSTELVPQSLDVVPGFEAIKLPLPASEMPTALAWTNAGTLVFGSLKGRVFFAVDNDHDGLEETLLPYSDDLPAPYGIATTDDSVDVLCKFGLVRLTDADHDGQADRSTVIASGWGYTADYHDWAVGLPRDQKGNYYVGLPCQQDDRSPSSAIARGTVLRLRPLPATDESPRLFSWETISSGLRFPMGLALSREGELFCSDNQGNYNPFNEINHIKQGAHYGFVNKLDRNQSVPARTDPAINLPHPWTRSVNGICFLDLLDSKDSSATETAFGPFAHHLIGCEYDTRRLIRMTLQNVEGQWQGCAYPFSYEPREGVPTFEGPVVCAVSPRGELYVGNLRDSGWGGGSNTGSMVRLRFNGKTPCGIREVQALSRGFRIHFTSPVNRQKAGDLDQYKIVGYRRTPTPAYGSPDEEFHTLPIRQVTVSEDGLWVDVTPAGLRSGFVYEIRVKNLAPSGEEFFPAEAHYTVHRLPKD